MRMDRWLIALALLAVPSAACAGAPFLTDDPAPTEPGRWEIYAPLVDLAGRGVEFQGAAGIEVSYGAAPDVQLTLGIPLDYAHDRGGWRWGRGDAELSAKVRIVHDEAAGFQLAVFPGLTLPTGSNGFGAGRVTALLPVWAQQDIGRWSVFGGGGYAINPGAGNRDYWTGGAAVTRKFGERLTIGVEADRQGPDTVGGRASTSLGIGAIYQLKAPFRLLASGGPTFEDGDPRAGFHMFLALGVDL
jgi:Putative MetA-pathway of phenol degradation